MLGAEELFAGDPQSWEHRRLGCPHAHMHTSTLDTSLTPCTPQSDVSAGVGFGKKCSQFPAFIEMNLLHR